MVLVVVVVPPRYPLTAPPPPTATPTPTPTPTPRFCGRAGRRGNRSGQGGYADGGSDGCSDRRSHRADTPKHNDRHSCDGLSQQLARSLCFSASVRGRENAISHSAYPSFLSSHLHFQAGCMRDLRVDSAATDRVTTDRIPVLFPTHLALGKIPRDPYLGSSRLTGCRSSRMAQTQHTHGSLFCQAQDGCRRGRFL